MFESRGALLASAAVKAGGGLGWWRPLLPQLPETGVVEKEPLCSTTCAQNCGPYLPAESMQMLIVCSMCTKAVRCTTVATHAQAWLVVDDAIPELKLATHPTSMSMCCCTAVHETCSNSNKDWPGMSTSRMQVCRPGWSLDSPASAMTGCMPSNPTRSVPGLSHAHQEPS